MLVASRFLSIMETDFKLTLNGFIVIVGMELFIFKGIFFGTLWGLSSVDKYRNFLFKD